MKWLVLVLTLQTSLVFADVPPGPPPKPAPAPRPDSEGFTPVTDRDLEVRRADETVNGATMVGLAYGFIFSAVLGYVVWMGRRAHRIEGDLNNLHARLAKKLDAVDAAANTKARS